MTYVDIEKTMEFILAQQAAAEAQMAAMREQMEADQAKSRQEIAGIRTILAETAQIQRGQARTLLTMENGITRLTAAQEVTEQKLQGLIDWSRRGHNGNPQAQ